MSSTTTPPETIEAMAETVWVAACIQCEGDVTAAEIYLVALDLVERTKLLSDAEKAAIGEVVRDALFWRDFGALA